MSRIVWMVFAIAALAAPAPARAAEVAQPKRPVLLSPEQMQTYYLVLLYRGDNTEKLSADSANAIQSGHMANILRLHDEKKLVLSGPVTDDTDLRFFNDNPAGRAGLRLNVGLPLF